MVEKEVAFDQFYTRQNDGEGKEGYDDWDDEPERVDGRMLNSDFLSSFVFKQESWT